jgi:hypothetical protein
VKHALQFLLSAIVFALGLLLVFYTQASAIRTFVLPRAAPDPIPRAVFLTIRRVFDLLVGRLANYSRRDAMMAFYAPISLLALPPVWLALLLIGYGSMYWGLGVRPVSVAIMLSGSSLFTLGFAVPHGWWPMLFSFSEAAVGLIFGALFIGYLPTIYGAFSRREAAVTLLEIRAGTPPSGVSLLIRMSRSGGASRLSDVWEAWVAWFADVEESHTSLGALSFFRSPQPYRHWVTAAGAVLDGAALATAVLDNERDASADLCLRAGALALGRIADYFNLPHKEHDLAEDEISVSRWEFESALDALEDAGLPVKEDREAAWHAFAATRDGYDTVLLALAALTMAPYAPWSSDRSLWRTGTMRSA